MPNLSFAYLCALASATSLLTPHPGLAGPLTSAQVTKVINQVSVVDPAKGGHPAALHEVIKNDLGLQTGVRSRSELLFQDNTLTRIGAETFFSFKTGTRDLTLEKGSMLLQVPKGLGGATIHTAAVTAAITGTTIMMEYIPHQYIKVLVLEGSLRLSRNGTFGDSLILHPGKMVIMRPDAKRIPEPIDVDLAQIVQTSTLVNFPGSAVLPSMPLIDAAIETQQSQIAKRDLVPTNLVMGHGTKVLVTATNPLVPTAGIVGALPTVVSSATGSTPKSGGPAPVLVETVADALKTTTASTATVANTVVAATTETVGTVTNNLANTTSNVASLPVTSSSELVSLVSNVAPATSGIVNIVPTPVTSPAGSGAATVTAVTTPVTNVVGTITSTQPATSNNPSTSRGGSGGGLLGNLLKTVTTLPATLLSGKSQPPAPPSPGSGG